jgi:hypothetical protein
MVAAQLWFVLVMVGYALQDKDACFWELVCNVEAGARGLWKGLESFVWKKYKEDVRFWIEGVGRKGEDAHEWERQMKKGYRTAEKRNTHVNSCPFQILYQICLHALGNQALKGWDIRILGVVQEHACDGHLTRREHTILQLLDTVGTLGAKFEVATECIDCTNVVGGVGESGGHRASLRRCRGFAKEEVDGVRFSVKSVSGAYQGV